MSTPKFNLCKISIASLLLLLSSLSCLAQRAAEIPSEIIEKELKANPDDHAHRVIAGFHYFDNGDYQKALRHFSKAAEIQPTDAYDQAWKFMAEIRIDPEASGASLREFSQKNPSDEFIDTAIKVLLGEVTPDKAVESAKLTKDLGNLCEAHYFSAQRLLADGQKERAMKHLKAALRTNKTSFWEYQSAIASLKQLEAKR